MENVCIRVKFSPLMKNISKNNSKCSLEIVPLVTCIENIDKIKWKHKEDKMEYILPMNYKIIIKKLKPNHGAIKVYYSCVDLLASALSNVDIGTGDVCRAISENIVLNKDKTYLMALANTAMFDKKTYKSVQHVNKSTNLSERSKMSPLSPNLSDQINMTEKLKNGFVQTEKDEATENRLLQDIFNHMRVDKSTSVILHNNQINIKTANRQNITKFDHKRILYITPVYEKVLPIYAKDYWVLDNLRTNKENSSIGSAFQGVDILKYYTNVKTRINRTSQSSTYHIMYESTDEEKIISNIRIKPEARVAKFIEKMEKEIMPLKIILDNIIVKCSSLGLYKNALNENSFLDTNVILGRTKIEKCGIQREQSYNRVVYSIVFDE